MGAYFRNAWLGFWTVLVGMGVTIRYFFSRPITLQYPDQRWEIPDGHRGKLDTDISDCIGCLACARACPVECITIETRKPPKGLDMGQTSDGTKKKLVVPRFDIDISICLYCGLCVEACPTGCIRMTKDYEYSTYNRETDLLLHFGKDLDPAVEAAAIERAKQLEAEAAKKAAEAPAKAEGESKPKAAAAKASGEAKPAAGKPQAAGAGPNPEAGADKPAKASPSESKTESPGEPPKNTTPGDSEAPS
jgi:NADH-quinone oxidoreductase subunit I